MVREFTNPIYPRALWVATRDELNTILTAFEPEHKDIEWSAEEFEGKNFASVPVVHKNTCKIGYLVVLSSEVVPRSYGSAAHEASHCAIWTCGDLDIGVSGENQEPFAYLVGYYTDCIMQVVNQVRNDL